MLEVLGTMIAYPISGHRYVQKSHSNSYISQLQLVVGTNYEMPCILFFLYITHAKYLAHTCEYIHLSSSRSCWLYKAQKGPLETPYDDCLTPDSPKDYLYTQSV